MENSPGRHLLDPLGQDTGKGITGLIDKISRHCCARFSVRSLHRKMVSQDGDRTLHQSLSSRSENSSRESLERKAAATTTTVGGHTIQHQDIFRGTASRHPKEQRETLKRGGRRTHSKLSSESKESYTMQWFEDQGELPKTIGQAQN